MKTADKLAQIARTNQQGMFNLIQNGRVIHQGSYDSCQAIMDEVGGTFTIKKAKEIDPYEQFQKKVRWGSHHYVRYVIKRCKELAFKGYGGVLITIGKTTDAFKIDEGRNSCYSHDFVCRLLKKQGFELYTTPDCDLYDAQEYTLFWDKYIQFAPDSEKIGMSWK